MTRAVQLCVAVVAFSILAGPLAQGHNNLQAEVERRMTVTEDKTVFTLFCLLNLAGYDEENDPAGMHPVRVQVRQQLTKLVPPDVAKRIRDYYLQHREASTQQFSVVAMATSGPPDFRFGAEWQEIKKDASFGSLENLPALLRELYATTPVEKIYADVQPDYRKFIEVYRAVIAREVSNVMSYCRVSTLGEVAGEKVQRAAVIPNLLDSYDNAFGFVLSDTLYSVEGPHRVIGFTPHEFVHSITSSISYDPQYETLQAPARPVYEFAKTLPGIGDVESLQNFLDENLVRAISLKYLDAKTPARSQHHRERMMQEYASGYILERFFYDQLVEYEKSNLPLSVYYPSMLKLLDARYELARWKQATQTAQTE